MSTACCSVLGPRCSRPAPTQRRCWSSSSVRLRQPAASATLSASTLPSSSKSLSDSQILRLQKPTARTNRRCIIRMGKVAPNGVFTPIVNVSRNVLGQKSFNTIRGKAISLHSQVIKTFCQQIGAEQKQIQGLIRLAKQNGGKLGFLS